MKPKHQRLILISSLILGLSLSIFLILLAFQDTLVFFYTPSDLLHKKISSEQRIRVGGLVAMNSTSQKEGTIRFKVTDQQETIAVDYHGLLPDLFREGQGVVVEGFLLDPTHFQATTVLAKHDETYMPKEVADRLKQTGLEHHAQ